MTVNEAKADLLAQDTYDPTLYKGVEYDAEGNQIEEGDGLRELLSDACVWWSKLTYCSYETSISMILEVGEPVYDGRDRTIFSAKILKPRSVIINDYPLYRRDGREVGLWTASELQRLYPSFRTAGNATPSLAVWLPGDKLRLYAPPDALYTGKNFVEGWTIPDALTAADDDDELPVPEEDHHAIVRLALDYGSLPQMDSTRETRQFRNESWWREQADRRKRENVTAILGRKTRGSAADWLWG